MESYKCNYSLEIEKLKSELRDLKREDIPLNVLNSNLLSLQDKYENLKEERRSNEQVQLNKYHGLRAQIQETITEKENLDKDYFELGLSIKTARISKEEIQSAIEIKQEEIEEHRQIMETLQEQVQIKEKANLKNEKCLDRLNADKRELMTSISKIEQSLKNALRQEKELEQECKNLTLKDSKLATDIQLLEKNIASGLNKEKEVNEKIKNDQFEIERLERFCRELENEIIESNANYDKLRTQRDDVTFQLKQETQKNTKIESSINQLKVIYQNNEDQHKILIEKISTVDQNILSASEELDEVQNSISEEKREMERNINQCVDLKNQIQSFVSVLNNMTEKLESHSRDSKFNELRSKLLSIIE